MELKKKKHNIISFYFNISAFVAKLYSDVLLSH